MPFWKKENQTLKVSNFGNPLYYQKHMHPESVLQLLARRQRIEFLLSEKLLCGLQF